ncbi:c-type cytochrome [Limobrevibacterium gyesilva]|uniref:Cytochrome c domain-containing protein n=1 Tax=Limobrevibacterium gyesilva TaxID=2991712 RepID=A0AA41YN95_9PROT|nr:c-type cytochrome [Limobrevibacterium gyesilva]MCW3473440.1 hypothetical protein [Limobrevibacterium gyesilva]
MAGMTAASCRNGHKCEDRQSDAIHALITRLRGRLRQDDGFRYPPRRRSKALRGPRETAKIAGRMATVWDIPGVIAAACLAMAPPCAYAQSAPNNAATGQTLAQQLCSRCHVVVPSGQRGWTDAPAFDAIANRQGATAAKLSAVIQKPHLHMLNTGLPQDQADAIAAYIISLRKG